MILSTWSLRHDTFSFIKIQKKIDSLLSQHSPNYPDFRVQIWPELLESAIAWGISL